MAHTKGPWRVGQDDVYGKTAVYAVPSEQWPKGYMIADADPGCGCCSEGSIDAEQAANLRLLAAAPEMLTLLRDGLPRSHPRVVALLDSLKDV